MDENLVTELIELHRQILADEYTIALARAIDGSDTNKATLVEDLERRIAETASRMDSLRQLVTERVGPPAASRSDRPKRQSKRRKKRSSQIEPPPEQADE